jgi:type IV pilus assembly protein PilB
MDVLPHQSEAIMHTETPKDKLIGQILMQEGLINEAQLESALSQQAAQATYKPVGEELREQGFITRRVLHDILLKYRKQILLGQLLLKMGAITERQLADALEVQTRNGKKLGQILTDRGIISRSLLDEAICVQLGIETMDLTPLANKEVLGNVSTSYLRSMRALPLGYDTEHQVLKVLMADPADKSAITELEKVFKKDVEPVMLRTDILDHLFDKVLDIWYLCP